MNGIGPHMCRIVGQVDVRQVHPAGEDALHRQLAFGALLVPDREGGIGQCGDVVADLAAESEGVLIVSACSSMIGKGDPAVARCESIPAHWSNPDTRTDEHHRTPGVVTEMLSTSPTLTPVCNCVEASPSGFPAERTLLKQLHILANRSGCVCRWIDHIPMRSDLLFALNSSAALFADHTAPRREALSRMLFHPVGKLRRAHQACLHRDVSEIRGGDGPLVAICGRRQTAEHGNDLDHEKAPSLLPPRTL